MRSLFTALFLLFLASCGANIFPGESHISERFPGIPEEFYYKTVGTCENGDLSFRVLSGAGAMLWDVFQTQSEADILTGQFEIFLNKDQTFAARYREFSFTSEVFSKTFTSAYSFDSFSREIKFENLGIGAIYKVKTRYYLQLKLTQNINSSLLKGQILTIRLSNLPRGLDTDREEYCNF